MPITDDYAELYTTRERLRFVAIALVIYAALYLLWSQWALPRWNTFASNAHCSEVWGVPGTSVLLYTLFVGMPLVMALLIAITVSRRSMRVLRDGQSPYRGEKVFRRTRIKRGRIAKLIGWTGLLAPLWFVAVALWGAPTAHDLIVTLSVAGTCETNQAPGTQ